MHFGKVFWNNMLYAFLLFILLCGMVAGYMLYGFYEHTWIPITLLSKKIDALVK
jgi:hypothetical protein